MNPAPDRPRAADASFFSALRAPTRFFLVRHGRSEGNARRIFQGRLDLPLDEEGRRQARDVGAWLAGQGLSRIVCSPLARAASTAAFIAKACGAAAEPIERLREIDTGVFTGLGWDECKERYPAAFSEFEWRSWDAVPGAEGSEALYERALEAWAALRDLAVPAGGNIAAVTHAGFLQWMIRATFGARSWMPLFSTANCGIFELFAEPSAAGPAYMQWRRLDFVAPARTRARPPRA
jgi:broad specificity phosphatase PhoE